MTVQITVAQRTNRQAALWMFNTGCAAGRGERSGRFDDEIQIEFGDRDDIAGVQLTAAPSFGLTVDLDNTGLDHIAGIDAIFHHIGQLECLAQADHVVTDYKRFAIGAHTSIVTHQRETIDYPKLVAG